MWVLSLLFFEGLAEGVGTRVREASIRRQAGENPVDQGPVRTKG